MAKKWTNEKIDSWLVDNQKSFCRVTDFALVSQPSTTLTTWKCSVDGHEWQARVDNIVGKGSGCPKCGGTMPLTISEVNDRIVHRSKAVCLAIHPGDQKSGKRADFECAKCSNQWTALLHNVLQHGYGCPTCNANMSTPCQSDDGEHFHSMLERSFWEATTNIRTKIPMERQAQYVHTRRFSCDFYFPTLMLLVEISGKSMMARPDYKQTIELKYLMAEAGHRHLMVLTDSTEISAFVQTLETNFL